MKRTTKRQRRVIGQVVVTREQLKLLHEIGTELRGWMPLESLIQTAFNCGLQYIRNDREDEGEGALKFMMEHAPEQATLLIRTHKVCARLMRTAQSAARLNARQQRLPSRKLAA
jgi:hypothetical protein